MEDSGEIPGVLFISSLTETRIGLSNAGLPSAENPYIPNIARARRAIDIATRVSGSSSCRPVSDWMRSTR